LRLGDETNKQQPKNRERRFGESIFHLSSPFPQETRQICAALYTQFV